MVGHSLESAEYQSVCLKKMVDLGPTRSVRPLDWPLAGVLAWLSCAENRKGWTRFGTIQPIWNSFVSAMFCQICLSVCQLFEFSRLNCLSLDAWNGACTWTLGRKQWITMNYDLKGTHGTPCRIHMDPNAFAALWKKSFSRFRSGGYAVANYSRVAGVAICSSEIWGTYRTPALFAFTADGCQMWLGCLYGNSRKWSRSSKSKSGKPILWPLGASRQWRPAAVCEWMPMALAHTIGWEHVRIHRNATWILSHIELH